MAARERDDRIDATSQCDTAGALFNRPNPLNKDHSSYVNPYVRSEDRFVEKRGDVDFVDPSGRIQTFGKQKQEQLLKEWLTDKNQKRYVPVYGQDWTSVNPTSHRKYRIPATSVVNKVGDLKLFCCLGWRLTAVRASSLELRTKFEAQRTLPRAQAQWIWWTNFVCCLAHTSMVLLTLYFAYWRWDLDMWNPKDTEHVTIRIHRITQIPTPEMIANNETKWSPGWNLSTVSRGEAGNEWYIRDNDMPVNFATLTLSFFAISAGFHFWACFVGLFERFWYFSNPNSLTFTQKIYWRQMQHSRSHKTSTEMHVHTKQVHLLAPDGRRLLLVAVLKYLKPKPKSPGSFSSNMWQLAGIFRECEYHGSVHRGEHRNS